MCVHQISAVQGSCSIYKFCDAMKLMIWILFSWYHIQLVNSWKYTLPHFLSVFLPLKSFHQQIYFHAEKKKKSNSISNLWKLENWLA